MLKAPVIASVLCLQVAGAAWGDEAHLQGQPVDGTDFALFARHCVGGGALQSPADIEISLFLSVTVNGVETGLLATFTWFPATGRIQTTPDELRAIGLAPPRAARGEVMLDAMPGLTYRFDEAAQSIEFSAPPERLLRRVIKGRHRAPFSRPQSGYGAVLNYRLTSNLGDDVLQDGVQLQNVFSSFEGRFYAPFGVLRTTGSVLAKNFNGDGARFNRDETTFSYASPKSMMVFNAGDIISSGQSWTRPIRMGGIQIRRDFSLRNDIVTDPQLSYSGTAALPTTVDVYVDNLNAWSGTVPPGPFTLTDLPMIDGNGAATIVIRDEAGNEETKKIDFFASETLLGKGRLDFSLEAGVAREDFGSKNSSYGNDRMAIASLRYGVTDRLTLQGHVEASSDLAAASAGISSVLFNRAEFGLSLGASRFQGKTGYMGHFDLRTELAGMDLRFSSTRHSDDYADLAYATALAQGSGTTDLDLLRPAKARDVLSLSAPLSSNAFNFSSLGVNLVNLEYADERNTILSGSYSRRMKWRDANLYVSGFKNFASGDYGFSARISVPLGKTTNLSSSFTSDSPGTKTAGLRVDRYLDHDVGSFGYTATLDTNADGDLWGQAYGSYRTRYGVIDARLQRMSSGRVSAAAGVEGAVVLTNAGVIAGNRINDGFAVVDLGIRDTPVLLHNQPVAKTGPMGKALVPGLTPYQQNRVSIDPDDLPLNANLNATAMQAVPARHSGVTLRMGRGVSASALVVLRDGAGQVIPVGSQVRVNGRSAGFIVGYDGEVWLEHLRHSNRITVNTGQGQCRAAFALPSEDTHFIEVECY